MVLTIPLGGAMALPERKPTRLKNYDYSKPNYYFITICTFNKQNIFSQNACNNQDCSEIKLNGYGIIAENELLNISSHFDAVRIDKYAVMPNHIHAIIVIGCNGETERSRPFPTLSTIVGLYKSGVSKRIHETERKSEIWQKSFYDSVIRNKKNYQEVWQYIDENPFKWNEDCLNINKKTPTKKARQHAAP